MKKKLFLLVTLIVYAWGGTNAQEIDFQSKEFQATSEYYNQLILGDSPQISLLNLFFTNMPKGGDLHHHYSGTIYAETYLDWVKQKNWKIDSCSLKIVNDNSSTSCTLLSVDDLMGNSSLYRRLLTLWSDLDYNNHFHIQPPPDQNFFNTFGYFGTVSDQYMDVGLKIIKERAVNENIQYIETMLSSVGTSSKNYKDRDKMIEALRTAVNQEGLDKLLSQIDEYYSKDKAFNDKIDWFISNVKTVHEGIDDDRFTMRFQSYASRVQDPLEVYTDLLAAFKAANKSELIVGVNIVAPENNHIALQDYTLHMMMFNYLYRKFEGIHRALHAGELTLGMVRPKDLIFHIDEALSIARAERIGHGVDISYEKNSLELLENLKKNAVVEINLTSNEFILGVRNNEHPYLIYSKYNVPMVISTDDSGVSRNNLTNEYVLLSSRYKPSYKEVKKYVYNSINYSFLSEDLKSKELKRLDNSFNEFEKMISSLGSGTD